MKHLSAAVVVISLAACMQEEVTSPAELTIEPASLDFGTIGLGGESSLEITVTNIGGSAASILSLTLTEGDSDVWNVDRAGITSVAAGETATMYVVFEPEDTQRYTGQAQLRTDVSDQESFVIGLKGTGGLSESDDDGDGYSMADGDCNDGDPDIHPRADERCNGQDDDCNGSVPSDEDDADSDGYRLCDDDCDDGDNSVNPGAAEACDDKDTDCDGVNDDYGDGDGDGLSVCDGDCDDTESGMSPDLPEVCDDGLDNDCDGITDHIDVDGDGHSACGDAPDCDDNDPYSYPIVVADYGSPTATGSEEDPLDTIENGVAALDGACNTLYVLPGTYDFALSWSGGTLEIEGTGNAADVVLQASKDARHATITGGDVTFRDLTFTGGGATEDGGSISVAAASLTLSGTVHQGNQSANDGGAVAVSSGTLTLRRGCIFDGNTAEDDGGAILLDAASLVDNGGTQYLGNTGKKGGAIYMVGGSADITDAVFRSNVATVEGGAIAATGTPSGVSIERNQFALNDAIADGGALALRDFSAPAGTFRNNRVQDNTAGAAGGGIAIVGAVGGMLVHNNTFTGNESVSEGAVVAVSVTLDASDVQLVSNVMRNNDGLSAMFMAPGLGALVQYNTGYGTNSGVHFGGALDGLDPTNVERNPELVDFSDDGNPDNDDLGLSGSSPEIDDGPPLSTFDDLDGSQNDRGYTGGAAAE